MGAVYRVVDDGGAVAALKLLHPDVGADPVSRARLVREVAALQRLRHPAVARVLDAEVDSTEAFIVTELVEGESLDEVVRREGPLAARSLADLADALADALAAVHEAGVVHRDVKPSNVMMTATGPVLIDFGLATAPDDAPLTATSLVAGSPGYLAPEIIDGGEPAPSVDWWGWAAVLAFAATGRAPFGTGTLGTVLARTRSGKADLDRLPARTGAMLHWALSPKPADRPDPDEVREVLRARADDPGSDPDPDDEIDYAKIDVTPAGHDAPTEVIPDDAGLDDDEAGDEDLDDDEGLDDEADDEGLDEVGVDGYVRPPARPRWGSLLGAALVVVAAGARWPFVTAAVVVGLLVVVRTVGSDVEAMHTRRLRRGVSRWDVPLAVVSVPWHLVRGALGLVPAVIIAAAGTTIVGGLAWWSLSGLLTTSGPGEELTGGAVAVATGLLVLVFVVGTWFGPWGRTTRVGARRTLAFVAPGMVGGAVVVVVCLVVAVMLLAQVAKPIAWWPVSPPSAPS